MKHGNVGRRPMPQHDWVRVEQRPNVTNANGEGHTSSRTAAEPDRVEMRGEDKRDSTRNTGSKAEGRASPSAAKGTTTI